MRSDFEWCLGLQEGRHDVGHFGNATGRGVFTDAGQLAFHSFLSKSVTSVEGFIFIQLVLGH
jgi:hypothetical protein